MLLAFFATETRQTHVYFSSNIIFFMYQPRDLLQGRNSQRFHYIIPYAYRTYPEWESEKDDYSLLEPKHPHSFIKRVLLVACRSLNQGVFSVYFACSEQVFLCVPLIFIVVASYLRLELKLFHHMVIQFKI